MTKCMRLSSPCRRRCWSHPKWNGTARFGGMSRSQNLNGRVCSAGSSLSVEKARTRSSVICGADSSARRFLSVRHRHQQQGPGLRLFDVRSPPCLTNFGLPHETKRFAILLALRCAADASIVVKSAARLTAQRAGARSGGRQPRQIGMVKPSLSRAQPLAS